MNTTPIQDYVESVKPIIEDSPQMGEATTKEALLRDFIELLGWKIPMNAELEYSVNAFGKVFKVDYASELTGDDRNDVRYRVEFDDGERLPLARLQPALK